MKVLLMAPQPFFQERGTPMAVRKLVESLLGRGWQIDLLTYHEGSEVVAHPNLRVFRLPRLPGIRNVRPGFSLKKIVCDIALFFKALGMVRRGRYDLVHAVEESVFIALWISRFARIPYVYDMDSSLSQQVVEKHAWMGPFFPLMRWIDRLATRRAEIVLPVCEALAGIARAAGAKRVLVLRDPPWAGGTQQRAGAANPRPTRETRFMYVGNLEKYQGIDLLLRGFANFLKRSSLATLLIVGGAEMEIEKYKSLSRRLRISEHVSFVGAKPASQLGQVMAEADVLVSPRIKGVNTPMKIYSYMLSGKPILATNIGSHTEVLTPDVAVLTAAEPDSFAKAMERLAGDAALRERLARRARALAEKNFSIAAYENTVAEFARLAELVVASGSPA